MAQSSLPSVSPIPGYRFIVFYNEAILGFQKVTGMSTEIETEVYHEGGLNTKAHIFPKTCSGERVLCMEKGAYQGEDPLFCLAGERLEGMLILVVMDNQGSPLKSYLFTGLMVKKWEVGELSADQNSILIDRFEVCYEEFEMVN